ncbi:glycosyltransferase [Rubripirellula reticaptiva]|uniref:Glycosyl transferases group 1 n=1 Tax=Rubripirellula reticaptiva TaxID=2528013 RepID=A0A5C6EGF8_9BACT|nr:glycosyltransferase [Rubripirellula reticaptiva]TWU47117.1 Glycosyl transferases group 1 [Rubripirellula reticaptiva]
MSRRRVLLIGRHFWPHGSIDSAAFLFQLACGLHRRDISVEVCTPRYATSWPEKYWLREIPVHRPAPPPRSDWSIGRYTRHLTQWIRSQGDAYDLVLVDAIREEAIAAIEASRLTGTATMLRYSGWGKQSDSEYWKTTRGARRCGTIGKMADTVIAKSAACNRALLTDRYSAERIVRIQPGFSAGPITSESNRESARRSLATANSDLRTNPDTIVALCNAPMTRDGGIQDLVHATYRMIDRHPNLAVWFIGDGPRRDWIYEHLKADGVRASIAMPGSFVDTDEIYAAADIYFQTDESGLDHFLPTAVSAELPIIAVESESVRSILVGSVVDTSEQDGPSNWVQWIKDPSPTNYVESVSQVLNHLPDYRNRSAKMRRHWLRSRPISATIDAYIDTIERTISRKKGSNRGATDEAAS